MPDGGERSSEGQGKGVYICINFLDNLVKCMEQLKMFIPFELVIPFLKINPKDIIMQM